jgi:hypothetical protein
MNHVHYFKAYKKLKNLSKKQRDKLIESIGLKIYNEKER